MNWKHLREHEDHVDHDFKKEGDDTMSAVTQNAAYLVYGKKDTPNQEPVVTQERLAKIKETVGKYLDALK